MKAKTAHLCLRDQSAFCLSPHFDVFDAAKAPFMFIFQYLKSEQLYIVPNSTLVKMASDLGKPKQPVTLLPMSGRCGSTLLVQMFNNLPQVRIQSEPWVLLHVHMLWKAGRISDAQEKELLKAATFLLLKPDPTGKVTHLAIKFNMFNIAQVPKMKELIPHAKVFFATRNMKDTFLVNQDHPVKS